MKLNREKLYNLYMKWVDNVPDEKSTFTPKEIVNAIVNIIETDFVWENKTNCKEQLDRIEELLIKEESAKRNRFKIGPL